MLEVYATFHANETACAELQYAHPASLLYCSTLTSTDRFALVSHAIFTARSSPDEYLSNEYPDPIYESVSLLYAFVEGRVTELLSPLLAILHGR